MSRRLRVGARGSRLSLWQLEHAIDKMTRRGLLVDRHILSASGDRDHSVPIDELPSDAPFVDDLERALRDGVIDVAVHSLKDMPVEASADLVVEAILSRGSITESLVSKGDVRLLHLPAGSVVGTSSARRRAQLLYLRPDLACAPIRGAVDGRVRQIRSGAFDAAILATAGLERLGIASEIAETFAPQTLAPAPGQGAIAIQLRADDAEARGMVVALDDFATRLATTAERAAERRLDAAGELTAAWALVHHASVTLHLRLLSREGDAPVDVVGSGVDPERVAAETVRRALSAAARRTAAVR